MENYKEMKKILYHSALFLLLASYTINVYAHCELDGLYHEGDTSVIGSHSQKNILSDNPIPNPDPYFPPDPVKTLIH